MKNRIVLVIVLVFFFISAFRKDIEVIDFVVIRNELKSFISKAKEESVLNGKYNVYALNFTADKKGYCVTFGFFSNLLHMSDIKKFKYYFQIDDDLIIVNYPPVFSKKYVLTNANFKLLNDRKLIHEKVSDEPFLGTHSGLVCCYYSNKVIKKAYDSDEFIPKNKAIFFYKYKGSNIELDSASFKESLKNRN